MPINRPYHRTCRQFTNGSYSEGGQANYILDARYAKSPEHYIRAFLILLKDVQELFDYIEPAHTNRSCYSFRIHQLLLRACIEVEANCKGILTENGYTRSGHMNMGDYKKINISHRLSSYQVRLPLWNGIGNTRSPFSDWATGGLLQWYQAYNKTKHDRHGAFEQATFEHMIEAVCGLQILLSSQFYTHDFGPSDYFLAEGPDDGMEFGIGGYLRVKFPDDWPVDERYEFDWNSTKDESAPFQMFNYSETS